MPRPYVSFGAAKHSWEKHRFGAPNSNDTTYYPEGFAGDDDCDIFALQNHLDDVVRTGTPVEDNLRPGWIIIGTDRGVTSAVPIRPVRDGGYEAKTGWPVAGNGVTRYSNGHRWRIG